VLHSPFCRTTDTANTAFDKASPAEYLSLLEVLEPAQAAQQTTQLNQVIESYKAKGNLVLVTHEPNISAVSFELIKHLDILVIDPNGDGEYTELGVIRFSASE
jgi:phosphohistidine phosphatase SixA